ncbi:MAG TPA: DUF4290 domain-containing protein [Bacteroidales bacterium]|jgi:hypothetical protein|nr:DUF4290 domain-containing protein [Bacteroidales bacterium]
MDYNTQRPKLIMPEYGRNVQKMIEHVKNIKDRDKRNEQIRAVVAVMGILNPQLRDLSDFRHKLWDHVYIISDFQIDIDSPYPVPTRETFVTKPNPIPLEKRPLKAPHYGRNIQNMIEMVANKEEGEARDGMILVLANYMRQQYLIWNKDTVSDETIFKDIVELSEGKIKIPENMHLSTFVPQGNSGNVHSAGHTSSRNMHRNFRQGNKKKMSGQKRNA